MTAEGGTGTNKITMYAGPNENNMYATGGQGDDTIKIYGGQSKDTIRYDLTAGTDTVTIDAGQGDDRLTVNKNQQNVTILSDTGTIICKSGDGGTTITVINVEHITLNGDNGKPICQYDAPSPPAVPTPPPNSQFDKMFIFPRAEGDLDQIEFGTPGKDKIEQYGGTGKTTRPQKDLPMQTGSSGGRGFEMTRPPTGSGDDKIYQYGGKGDNAQYIEVGAGNQTLIQVGGDGINIMQIQGGVGSATIEQYGGKVIIP